jgi:hypothetical protein
VNVAAPFRNRDRAVKVEKFQISRSERGDCDWAQRLLQLAEIL